ncbi:hypothetical protein [Nonomuraea jiangxiensis]|nr:hypothetical protein [Nonomuraea jiangxiensis]
MPFPLVVAAAVLLGWLVHRLAPHVFKRGKTRRRRRGVADDPGRRP